MNKKVEWYGEIPANIKWLTFADQRDKGYEYNKYFTEITASTDDNGGSITDEIEFKVAKNNTLQKRYTIVNFRQRGGKTATCKVTQKAGSKQNRLPVIDYDTLKLSVTPDGENIGWDSTSYTFSALANYDNVVYWYIDENDPKDKEHEVSRTPTSDTVTNDSIWASKTSGVNVGSTKGNFTFESNTSANYKTITVSATYTTKDGHSVSADGSVIQGTGVRTYQLEVNPVTLTWGADELSKKEFTVKSTYNDNYRFDYTISASTNFKYKKLKSEGLIDTYEIWPINNNPSKKPISEDLHVIQKENKNEKSLALNQLGVDMTPPFDYMVLKYTWKDTDGTDFDTATHVEGTEISDLDNKYVGYGLYPSSETLSYLKHGGDNQHSGDECAMINMKEIMDKCGDIESFDVYVAGNWYSRRDDGNVTCEMTLYSGGTMEGPTNFVFNNSGGKEVDKRSLKKNVFSKGHYIGHSYLGSDLEPKIEYAKAFYTTVAKITYYVKTKSATIEEDNTNNGVLINNFGAYPWDAQWNPKNIDAGEYKSRDTIQFKIEGEFIKDKKEERTFPISGTNVEADIKQYNGYTLISDTSWGCKINNITVIDNMISYDITIPANNENFEKTFDISFTVKTKLYEGGAEFDKTLMREYKQGAS